MEVPELTLEPPSCAALWDGRWPVETGMILDCLPRSPLSITFRSPNVPERRQTPDLSQMPDLPTIVEEEKKPACKKKKKQRGQVGDKEHGEVRRILISYSASEPIPPAIVVWPKPSALSSIDDADVFSRSGADTTLEKLALCAGLMRNKEIRRALGGSCRVLVEMCRLLQGIISEDIQSGSPVILHAPLAIVPSQQGKHRLYCTVHEIAQLISSSKKMTPRELGELGCTLFNRADQVYYLILDDYYDDYEIMQAMRASTLSGEQRDPFDELYDATVMSEPEAQMDDVESDEADGGLDRFYYFGIWYDPHHHHDDNLNNLGLD